MRPNTDISNFLVTLFTQVLKIPKIAYLNAIPKDPCPNSKYKDLES